MITGRRFILPGAIAAAGLLITIALTLLSHAVYLRNQHHLLRLRTRDAGSLLTAAVPRIETTLALAAELADATGGDPAHFRDLLAPDVAAGPTHQFVSVSLWRLGTSAHQPLVVIGEQPKLGDPRRQDPGLFARAVGSGKLEVLGMLAAPDPRLGYAYAMPGLTTGYAVYAEASLPANRRSPISHNSAFEDLDYALYLGADEERADLLLTSSAHLPLRGTTATVRPDFGADKLTLVMAARGPLDGSLPQDLPWIILVGGALLSAAVGFGTLRLSERRRVAERLARELDEIAGENRRLYAQQHTIAHTLQQALLPERLPTIAGLEASALYRPGDDSVEVGGDWYDVIQTDPDHALLVVGDVSGRGLRAATTMAALRYAIHAYVLQDDPPDVILARLSKVLSRENDRQLATILCVLVDLPQRTITVTSAGHLPPLLVCDGAGTYVQIAVGVPIGADPTARYRSTTAAVPPGATLLAFTDGLVERRGEILDVGLGRLATAAVGGEHDPLPTLLDELVAELAGPHQDDTAIVGLRWPRT